MTFTLVGERKSVDDGKIEVINYVTDSSCNGINITDKIKIPKSLQIDTDSKIFQLIN